VLLDGCELIRHAIAIGTRLDHKHNNTHISYDRPKTRGREEFEVEGGREFKENSSPQRNEHSFLKIRKIFVRNII